MADEVIIVEIEPCPSTNIEPACTEPSENNGNNNKEESGNLSKTDGRGGPFRWDRGHPFRGGASRGGGFQGGRGGGNFNSNIGGSGDRNEENQEFSGGRGRGRGRFRGGRGGGGRSGRGAVTSDDQRGDCDREQGLRSRGLVDKIAEKISSFQGPTYDLSAIDTSEKKFSGRNRLYIGNIANEVTDEELIDLFKPFGETSEFFMNKEKHFAFIRMDFNANAEKAKRELDGMPLKERTLKIRFAPSNATIKVKNLSKFVTNELLYLSFSPFGEIEKVHVYADERGKPTGEGYIDFARKFSAIAAVKKCKEGCYFLTSSLQPAIVELYDAVNNTDSYSEKNIIKKSEAFKSERKQPPRFAFPDSFEFEYGQKWKSLYEMFQKKEEALKKELQLEKEKLNAEMKYASYEQETELLRQHLRIREMDKDRQKREWEMKESRVEEERIRQEEIIRRQQEEMDAKMMANQEDMRRRQQENNLFMQAHNLNSLLEQTEQVYVQNQYSNQSGGSGADLDTKPLFESHNHFEGPDGQQGSGPKSNRGARGHWVSVNRRSAGGGAGHYQAKRRRF